MPLPKKKPVPPGQFSVYLTPAQLILLDRKARLADQTRSAYVRELILADVWPGKQRSEAAAG